METRDRTEAEALRIAHAVLMHLGWRFNPADIGKTAREIIDALDKRPETK